MTAPDRSTPPFPTALSVTLGAQALLALVAGGFIMVTAGSAGEWADLVRVVGGMLAVAYLTGVGIAGLLARYVLRSTPARIAAAVLLPPLATALFILVVRG